MESLEVDAGRVAVVRRRGEVERVESVLDWLRLCDGTSSVALLKDTVQEWNSRRLAGRILLRVSERRKVLREDPVLPLEYLSVRECRDLFTRWVSLMDGARLMESFERKVLLLSSTRDDPYDRLRLRREDWGTE